MISKIITEDDIKGVKNKDKKTKPIKKEKRKKNIFEEIMDKKKRKERRDRKVKSKINPILEIDSEIKPPKDNGEYFKKLFL